MVNTASVTRSLAKIPANDSPRGRSTRVLSSDDVLQEYIPPDRAVEPLLYRLAIVSRLCGQSLLTRSYAPSPLQGYLTHKKASCQGGLAIA